MKPQTVSMRELQQNLKAVVARVERGETVELTRRRRVVARLVPAAEARPVPPWPDLEARARAEYAVTEDRPGASELLIQERNERW
jgi:prevent-host-death family protein